MATARKPFVRLETSLHREAWSRDEKMTLCELMMFLGDRWARDRLTAEEACKATLTRHQLAAITGRSQLKSARRSLRALSKLISISVEDCGEFTAISWPKFAKTQELESRGRELKSPTKARPKPESAPAPAPAPVGVRAPARPQPKPRSKKPTPGWALTAAGLLATRLETVPGARITAGAATRWAKEIAQMPNEIPELADLDDKALLQNLTGGIEYALGPDNLGQKFEVVIRSGSAFRKKWPQLRDRQRRQELNVKPSRSVDDFVSEVCR